MENYRYEFITPNEMLDIRLEFLKDTGSAINKHYHDWIELVYLVEGDLEIQINNRTFQMNQNEFVVVNPMSIHSTCCRYGNTAILLQIPMDFLEKFVSDIREYSFLADRSCLDQKAGAEFDRIGSILQKLWEAYCHQPEGYLFRCYGLIFELIYILVHSFSRKTDRKERRKNHKDRERIQTIIDYVADHYREPVGIKEVAGFVGLNEIYFSRYFKANMGVTFLEYLYRVRLEKIYKDLLNTNMSIQDIQGKHGFCNDKVFRRMFREIYGCSPREARKV